MEESFWKRLWTCHLTDYWWWYNHDTWCKQFQNSQKLSFYTSLVHGEKWRHVKHVGIFWHQCFIFPQVTKLHQTSVIVYDKIFDALAGQGDILLSRPFLNLISVRSKLPPCRFSTNLPNVEAWGAQTETVWWMGNAFQMPSVQQGIGGVNSKQPCTIMQQQQQQHLW